MEELRTEELEVCDASDDLIGASYNRHLTPWDQLLGMACNYY